MIANLVLLGMFGGQEIIIILIIVLLLFGGTKIPQLMRGLGRGMNEFKKAKDGVYDDLDVNDTKSPKTDKNNSAKSKEDNK
jgi:sec-independent protein translocase protein TatA